MYEDYQQELLEIQADMYEQIQKWQKEIEQENV